MKTGFQNTNQYNQETARKFIVNNVPVQCTTSHIETQYKYVDKQKQKLKNIYYKA